MLIENNSTIQSSLRSAPPLLRKLVRERVRVLAVLAVAGCCVTLLSIFRLSIESVGFFVMEPGPTRSQRDLSGAYNGSFLCLNRTGVASNVSSIRSSCPKCDALLIAVTEGTVEAVLVKFNEPCTPPVIIALKRKEKCARMYGTLSLLLHPRVYWLITDEGCIGDSFASTTIVSFEEAKDLLLVEGLLKYVTTRVLAFASLVFAENPGSWTSWHKHLNMTRQSFSDLSLTLRRDAFFDIEIKPRQMEPLEPSMQRFTLPTSCEPRHRPSLPMKVFLHESLKSEWLFDAIREVLHRGSVGSGAMVLAANLSHANMILRTSESFNNGDIPIDGTRLQVAFSRKDQQSSGVCGAFNVNTWSTTDSMDLNWGIPWSLADKFHKIDESGKFIVDDLKEDDRENYLASFMGTHTKDSKDGNDGIIRNVLRLLHEPQNRIVVYTRCHEVHPEECAPDDERERLFFFDEARRPYNYSEILGRSHFCLVPKGRQPCSYRFLEAVVQGCTPVYISDVVDRFTYGFFLHSTIPWEKLSFYVHGVSVTRMPDFLREVSEEERGERRGS